MIGLDTGYFFRLAEKTEQSIELLHTAMEEERDVVVCTIAIYELLRHRMRGSLDAAVVDLVLDNRAAFRWVADTYDVLRRAAGISHGMGLHMADALIAAACETRGTETFYTRNVSDFEKYEGPMEVVSLD
ncbi:putative nucleic acid-binding protein [Salinibacter ruber]|uniref:type II toxin-antitoxin system VapC family toxin n=1 Tax=Salinibacter ruber TaxID=146919 RepID=UPI002169277F|nr:PIN domain-containing protein [Salinibacter ruber]MCS3672755.1 putative nucleic acid-binding protein [Salinibacter ruber]